MHVKGVFHLTLISAALRALGTATNLYLLHKLGAAGVGRTSMLASVCGFFSVVATSGVSLGMTRLTAEAIATHKTKDLRRIRAAGFTYAAFFGTLAAAALFFAAPALSAFFDSSPSPVTGEAAHALKIWAPGMLMCAVSSALGGYFIGTGNAVTASMCTGGGQVIRAALLFLQLAGRPFWESGGMTRIAAASTTGEIATLMALLLFLSLKRE